MKIDKNHYKKRVNTHPMSLGSVIYTCFIVFFGRAGLAGLAGLVGLTDLSQFAYFSSKTDKNNCEMRISREKCVSPWPVGVFLKKNVGPDGRNAPPGGWTPTVVRQ